MTSLPWALNFAGLCASVLLASYAVAFSILLRAVLSGESNRSRRRVTLDRLVFARLFLAYPAYRFLLAAINVSLSLYYFDTCFPGSLFAPHEVVVSSATYLWFLLSHLLTKILQLAGSETGSAEMWSVSPLKISTSSQLAAVAFAAMNLSAITPVAHLAYTWVSALLDAFRHDWTVEEDTAEGIADLEERRQRQREVRPSVRYHRIEMEDRYSSPVPRLLAFALLILVLGGVGYLFMSDHTYIDWLASRVGWILLYVVVAFVILLAGAALAVVTDSPEDNSP